MSEDERFGNKSSGIFAPDGTSEEDLFLMGASEGEETPPEEHSEEETPPEGEEAPPKEEDDAGVAEGEEDDEANEVVKSLRAQISTLQQELVKLAESSDGEEGEEGSTEGTEEEPEAEPAAEDEAAGEPFALTEDDYQGAMDNKGDFERVLRLFGDKHKSEVIEAVIRRLPKVVGNLVQRTVATYEVNRRYYAENPQLVPFVPLQRRYAVALEQEHPDWGLEQLLKESGKKVAELLKTQGIGGTAEGNGKEGKKKTEKPAFAGGGDKGGGVSKQLSEFEKLQDEMFPSEG